MQVPTCHCAKSTSCPTICDSSDGAGSDVSKVGGWHRLQFSVMTYFQDTTVKELAEESSAGVKSEIVPGGDRVSEGESKVCQCCCGGVCIMLVYVG